MPRRPIPIGRNVPQWIGTAIRGRTSHRLRRLLRVHVAGTQAWCPSPRSGTQRHVHLAAERFHAGVDLGVARQRDPVDQEAEGREDGRSREALRGMPRRHCNCYCMTTACSPERRSRQPRQGIAREPSLSPRGPRPGRGPVVGLASRRSEGRSRGPWCTCETSMPSSLPRAGRGRPVAAQGAHARPQDGVGEEPDAAVSSSTVA